MKLLELESVRLSYHGSMEVIHGVSLSVEENSITAIIGNNGGGKSSILKAIIGLVKLKSGKILFRGANITGVPVHKIVQQGISLVPEDRRLFPYMTVRDNLKLGAFPRQAWASRNKKVEVIYDMFPSLRQAKDRQAITLSGGEQQMLAIGRGLMSEPKLLMLDEISTGLAPYLVTELFNTMKRLNETGLTIITSEQNVSKVLNISNMAYVVENGEIVLHGSGKELIDDKRVREAYLRL